MKNILVAWFLLVGLASNAQQDSTSVVPDSIVKQRKNYLALSHEFSTFSNALSNWNATTLEAKLNKDSWVFVPKISVGQRFGFSGWYAETEAYKKFKSDDYLMLLAGGTSSEIFAQLKVGVEYNNAFAKKWEHSFGANYLRFGNGANLGLSTLSLSKYTGKFLSTVRINLGISDYITTEPTFSFGFKQRYYHTDDTYSAFFVGYGYDPTINVFPLNNPNFSNKTDVFNIGISTLQRISKRMLFSLQAEFLNYRIGEGQRQQYSVMAKLMYQL